MPDPSGRKKLYDVLRKRRSTFDYESAVALFARVDQGRVERLANSLSSYISRNLPRALEKKESLADYRTNPYVVMTMASALQLDDLDDFAQLVVYNKLYAGLETSFGKSIESAVFPHYPILEGVPRWSEPEEKIAELRALEGMGREERARWRSTSIWREIDKSCVLGNRRYLLSVKSGPNCINDTQVEAMRSAIADHHSDWLRETRRIHPEIAGIDVVIGITYGTDKSTNNKENQILAKLLEHGFAEEDQAGLPGVLMHQATKRVRAYRMVGKDFWALVGNPADPARADCVFLEILLALAKALSRTAGEKEISDSLDRKIMQLSAAIAKMAFRRETLPSWIKADFSDTELVWLASALSAFYDEGI